MASSPTALNGMFLVAAVFLVLLHPSMEEQPGPGHHGPDPSQGQHPPEEHGHHCGNDTDQQPPPPTPTPAPPTPTPPTPTPTPPTPGPLPPPTPTPAPAPAVDCATYCNNQCYPACQANQTAGWAQCWAQANATAYSCYDSCSNNSCSQSPDQAACLNNNSLCSFGTCSTCNNTYISPTWTINCCDVCRQAPSSQYQSCTHYWDLYKGYCIMDCYANCQKNCTTMG